MAAPPGREYVLFDPLAGYPMGRDLYYECPKCGGVISSMPTESTHCGCRYIMIDIDYGRISGSDPAYPFRLFRKGTGK